MGRAVTGIPVIHIVCKEKWAKRNGLIVRIPGKWLMAGSQEEKWLDN